jgi:hypothetical protein
MLEDSLYYPYFFSGIQEEAGQNTRQLHSCDCGYENLWYNEPTITTFLALWKYPLQQYKHFGTRRDSR